MLASLLRPKGRRDRIDQTPFSSPFAPSETSPWFQAAARRAPRRARDADHSSEDDAPELEEIDEEVDEDWVGQEDEEDDGPVESTPLLPIFSSSHLGTRNRTIHNQIKRLMKHCYRCSTRVRYHPCYPSADRLSMRDDLDLGPAALASGVSVPGQTDPAKDHGGTLFTSHTLCFDGQLPTVPKGNATQSRQQWC